MKKPFVLLIAVLVIGTSLYFGATQKKGGIKIGIVVPVQHAALDEIVAAFKSELQKVMGDTQFTIEVQNALGDINLQRSAINKFINEKVALLVPVGTATTQMALQLAPKNQSVLFLAANIPANSALASQYKSLMGIADEISVALQLDFLKRSFPDLKKVSLVYSSGDKVFGDTKLFVAAAEQDQIIVQQLMINNLSELYTLSKQIASDSDAIFILKDNLVASGINSLVQQANKLKIPLITSDEGTVKSGAAFAVGVIEADTGKQGAHLASKFFAKKLIAAEFIQDPDKISVFVNKNACASQGVELNIIEDAAVAMQLEVLFVGQ